MINTELLVSDTPIDIASINALKNKNK